MSGWQDARRILCVRLDNLGDVLMTTPAIRALKRSAPDRHITLLASHGGAIAAPHVPEIDSVIAYDAPWMKLAQPTLPYADLAMRSTLESRRFDAAVIFTVYSQSPLPAAMFCHLAGIPLRLAHCRENPYHLLTDWVRETEPETGVRHEVRRQLDLVAAVGARTEDERLSFRVGAEDRMRATMRLAEAGIDPDRPWIALHPGATAASRRYDPERFARVAFELAKILGCQVAVTGGAAERELCERVRRLAGPAARSLAGRLDLAEFAGLMAEAPLLISNNTGAVHLAAAVGTPVVDLYALTNPQHTPWLVPHRVLSRDVPCRNCYRSVCPHGTNACLDIPVDSVVAAACEVWNRVDRRIRRAA
ncbi:MAG TPA: glycosyltransferase family 9 protein [Usitatibacter sp.]|nr:glycosyltransferase family 9 protein [Usitatibacter sp.]